MSISEGDARSKKSSASWCPSLGTLTIRVLLPLWVAHTWLVTCRPTSRSSTPTGLARLAARGVLTTVVARLWAKSDAGMVRARVTVLIPESDQF